MHTDGLQSSAKETGHPFFHKILRNRLDVVLFIPSYNPMLVSPVAVRGFLARRQVKHRREQAAAEAKRAQELLEEVEAQNRKMKEQLDKRVKDDKNIPKGKKLPNGKGQGQHEHT